MIHHFITHHHQMGRPPCCDKSNVKRGTWTPEEDARILAYVANRGIGNWTLVPKKAGLNRCGRSCRLRWTNYLRPNLKHESFTPQEEQVIINLHELIGSRWSLIAKHLPGRTDNDVKNYWYTKLRKKLSKMGIDPVTHKPISQVLLDYGNINSLPSDTDNYMGSLGKNLRNMTLVPKSEPSSAASKLPWQILAQGQGISNHGSLQTNFFGEITSSCSSSASNAFSKLSSPRSSSFQASESQITPTSSTSGWSEFILTDPLLHESPQQVQQQKYPLMSPASYSAMKDIEISQCKANGELEVFGAYDNCSSSIMNQVNIHTDASSSSTNSFVDAILDRDTEISSQFELLDVSFDD